ncbi:MAG: ATP-binding protein [Selenomonadaceae bacterium]|nr:ATP-binding protein [Selenomonadaceae bacterium]
MNLNEWKKYPASREYYQEMSEDIQAAAQIAGLSKKLKSKLRLGMEEAIVNIINYAYKNGGDIFIRATTGGDEYFIIELVDFGVKFNPLEFDDPRSESKLPLEETKPGGKGILLIKKIFTKTSYVYEEFQDIPANHLILSLKKC